MKKKILIGGLIIVLVGGIFAFVSSRPSGEINMNKATIHAEISAANLVKAFEDDETKANENYSSKVLAVKGLLVEVKNINELETQLTLKAENSMGNVLCNIKAIKQPPLEKLKIGEVISIKGLCTGFLFDVVLDNCIILN